MTERTPRHNNLPDRTLPDRTFIVRGMTKKELAYLYFPDASSPHAATNRLMSWIARCRPLAEALLRTGYVKSAKWLTPLQVQLIVDYLGEP